MSRFRIIEYKQGTSAFLFLLPEPYWPYVIERIQLKHDYSAHLTKFDAWLSSLRDGMTKRRLVARLRKAQLGNLGDIKPVGDGIVEMRKHFGPGWRMYYVQRGNVIIIILGGGDKSTQTADIAEAKQLADSLED